MPALAILSTVLAAALVMTAGPASADDVSNRLDSSVDAAVEIMPLNAAGPNGTTTLFIDPTNDDGKNGCNLTGATTLVVALHTSDSAVATVSPSSVTFSSCGTTFPITVSPHAAGTAQITVTQTSNTSQGTFTLTPAAFQVNVTAAVNHAPAVSVTGITQAAYELGADTLPTPGCLATDDEDGVTHPMPAVTEHLDGFGLGAVDVRCSYTDAGGLQAVSSTTYTVVDTTAPTITLASRTPANDAGWNNGAVTVVWACSDGNGSGTTSASVTEVVNTEGEDQDATATCTDNAGNAASGTVHHIAVDTTDPTITFSRSPDANAHGWNKTDVSVSWTCADDGSGPVDEGGSVVVSTEGTTPSLTRTCTDLAGNSATDGSSPVSIDKTAPTIHLTRTPAANENGWNDGPVTVSWTCDDDVSATTDDGGSTTLAEDGADQTVTRTCTDLAGNTASDTSSEINIDTSAPDIHISRDPAANTNGWNDTDVTVTWTCDDDVSAPTDEGGSVTLTDDGADQSVSRTCTDLAGNTAGDTVSGINIDKTPPTIHIGRTPAANGQGWNNTDVTVSWTCDDELSGATDANGSTTLSDQGAGQSADGTCTDHAGNTAGDTVSGINIDKTAPSIHISRSPAANTYGWNRTDVTVSWICNDDLSGAVSAGDSLTLSDEQANQSALGSCADKAGNTSTDRVDHVSIDKTAPDVSWSGTLTDGATYYFGQVPVAPTCSASDGMSGLVGACSVSGYSTAVGHHTLSASALDKAGNVQTLTRSYDVLAWTLKGFYQPVDMNGVWNLVKGGSTVPLKFEAFRGATELTDVPTLGASFTVKGVACGTSAATDDVELTTTGGTTLRYDSSGGQFIQNWQTPKNAGACYQVTMTSADGTNLGAMFKLK